MVRSMPTSASSASPIARSWFAVGKQGVLVRSDASVASGVVLPSEAELRNVGLSLDESLASGAYRGSEGFAVVVPDDFVAPPGWSHLGIRALVDAFDADTFSAAATAGHVVDWWTTSRFCGRCGTPSERVIHERCMRCPQCGLTMYPRISPAVIVLVRRGDQALLARNARFPVPFYSTLAGFTEVGETLEQTLHREVFEEVGVTIKCPNYFGSQPWPFPHSLMVGFTAEWESGDLRVDQTEIADAQWFSANELPMIPPPVSIARRLIDAWVAEISAKT